MDDFMQSVQKWWAKPFATDMSVGGWFLFLGLLIVLSIMWNMVLRFITEE